MRVVLTAAKRLRLTCAVLGKRKVRRAENGEVVCAACKAFQDWFGSAEEMLTVKECRQRRGVAEQESIRMHGGIFFALNLDFRDVPHVFESQRPRLRFPEFAAILGNVGCFELAGERLCESTLAAGFSTQQTDALHEGGVNRRRKPL